MYLKKLHLTNYRNYEKLNIEFNKNINLIVGENGQGKTNIVEAIHLMSIGKSFRTSRDKELIKFNHENLYVKGDYFGRNRDMQIEILIQNNKKGIKVNSYSIQKIQELLGNFYVVVFSPEDLKLIKDGPKERRNFMDKEISQISPMYYHYLSDYNKKLSHRNKLIKNKKIDFNLLDVYDETLCECASHIYIYRMKFIKNLAEIAKNMHFKLTSGKESIELDYKNQININENDSREQVLEKYKKKLIESRDSDIYTKTTKVGIHRDDIFVTMNGMDIKSFGSQGQQRTASISLKLSEIELIKQSTNENPVLILDDVFSELDKHRQKLLIDNLFGIQMFITSAEFLHKDIFKDDITTTFCIDSGKVVKII